jgi:hypothetical protein
MVDLVESWERLEDRILAGPEIIGNGRTNDFD